MKPKTTKIKINLRPIVINLKPWHLRLIALVILCASWIPFYVFIDPDWKHSFGGLILSVGSMIYITIWPKL